MNNSMRVIIEKLVFGGQAMGRAEDGKVVFVWNALPGEEVEVEVIKKKKDHIEAVAIDIIKPSLDRLPAGEEHYLSCSPWQIMSWEKENEWKKKMANEVYKKIGGLELDLDISFDSDWQYGYRNKMEYSFVELDSGKISLAFFARGKKYREPNQGCKLADKKINDTAAGILDWINKHKIPIRSLKSLILRSNNAGETIAALFIKDKLEFADYPELRGSFLGFQLYYSTHKSPASVPTGLLYSVGQDYLIATLGGVDLKFGLLSFFQVHIPVFSKALVDIGGFLDKDKPVIDFYSGVGSISLPLYKQVLEWILVDNNQEAIDYAKDNIVSNEIKNCQVSCQQAEKLTELITFDKIIVLDPPRAGLHHEVVNKLNKVVPERIIYLSCNLSTQARDVNLLSSNYHPVFTRLYNFFPRTPHVESLVVLERN